MTNVYNIIEQTMVLSSLSIYPYHCVWWRMMYFESYLNSALIVMIFLSVPFFSFIGKSAMR